MSPDSKVFLVPVSEQPPADVIEDIGRPIDERSIRAWATSLRLHLERLPDEREFRLWPLEFDESGSVPLDLTLEGEYVDTLEGIAFYLLCSDPTTVWHAVTGANSDESPQ